MHTNSRCPRWTLLATLILVESLAACGGTPSGGGTAGAGGGGAGSAGAGVAGSTAGAAGVAGTAGAAGVVGTAGAAGVAGTAGAAGVAGSAGAVGVAGTGGAAVSAGAAGTSGGAGRAGTAGAGGSKGTAGAGGSSSSAGSGGAAGAGARWMPAKGTTFYWDLSNAPPDNTKNVGAYDIDGWNNTAAEVAALHARGLKVVCYMDLGTYEPGRPDSKDFPAAVKGSGVSGWPGELWLDVRAAGPSYAALQAIMLARFKVCQQKGFDAVEPDNLDSFQNKPGFASTAADQLAYNKWIATTVHGLGMAVFQKNDLDQVDALEPFFDGILDEECNKYSECSSLAAYTAAGKPVWDAEYKEDGESTAAFCAADVKAGIVGALFALDLDGSLFEPCSNDVGMTH